MNYLVQIDGTAPRGWRTVKATNREAAIIEAIKPLLADGKNPERAFVALGETRHPNGAPVCVQSFRLQVNRDPQPAKVSEP